MGLGSFATRKFTSVHNHSIANTALYTEVAPFYEALIKGIKGAKERVSMMYFTLDSGEWARKIGDAMVSATARGVKVRLMVDQYGLLLDNARKYVENRFLMKDLENQGIDLCMFDPKGHAFKDFNRLHVKLCAIDSTQAFIGGSNIGDHYLELSDHNFQMQGDLGPVFHDVYDYIRSFSEDVIIKGLVESKNNASEEKRPIHLSQLHADDAQLWLTIPKERRDFRRALLDVILDADEEVNIRTWYFIPDREILDALQSQASNGVKVRILISNKTKIKLIDAANPALAEELTKAGAQVYRYTASFMHAKAAWNNKGEVLFGSANLDGKAMASNFELSVFMRNPGLAKSLTEALEKDCAISTLHKIGDFASQSFAKRTLAHFLKLATPWL